MGNTPLVPPVTHTHVTLPFFCHTHYSNHPVTHAHLTLLTHPIHPHPTTGINWLQKVSLKFEWISVGPRVGPRDGKEGPTGQLMPRGKAPRRVL